MKAFEYCKKYREKILIAQDFYNRGIENVFKPGYEIVFVPDAKEIPGFHAGVSTYVVIDFQDCLDEYAIGLIKKDTGYKFNLHIDKKSEWFKSLISSKNPESWK